MKALELESIRTQFLFGMIRIANQLLCTDPNHNPMLIHCLYKTIMYSVCLYAIRLERSLCYWLHPEIRRHVENHSISLGGGGEQSGLRLEIDWLTNANTCVCACACACVCLCVCSCKLRLIFYTVSRPHRRRCANSGWFRIARNTFATRASPSSSERVFASAR